MRSDAAGFQRHGLRGNIVGHGEPVGCLQLKVHVAPSARVVVDGHGDGHPVALSESHGQVWFDKEILKHLDAGCAAAQESAGRGGIHSSIQLRLISSYSLSTMIFPRLDVNSHPSKTLQAKASPLRQGEVFEFPACKYLTNGWYFLVRGNPDLSWITGKYRQVSSKGDSSITT